MSGFSGTLRERVSLLTPTATRDALGTDTRDWTFVTLVWASVAPAGQGAAFVGDARDGEPVWRVTMRPCPVKVGDRIERTNGIILVREVIDDPSFPDRIVAIGERVR